LVTGRQGVAASWRLLRLVRRGGSASSPWSAAVAFPCSSKLLAQHATIDRRGRANGAIAVGLALGPAFGTYVGGLILARFGWRVLFLSLGTLSLLWLWPWLTGPARDLRRTGPASLDLGPPFREIVRLRAALGAGRISYRSFRTSCRRPTFMNV